MLKRHLSKVKLESLIQSFFLPGSQECSPGKEGSWSEGEAFEQEET